jgi:predicted transcriptional regulator
MIEAILGSKSCEQVLIFLAARETGYASEIAGFFSTDLYAVQKQMYRLESSDILVSRKVGRTRLYEFNPRSLFLNELKALLEKVLEYYPEEVREDLLMNRRRPRKQDKPL